MKKINELRSQLKQVEADAVFYAKKENCTPAEEAKFKSLREQAYRLGTVIAYEEAIEKGFNKPGYMSGKEIDELGKFSFIKFIRESINNSLTGFESEMHQEGVRELQSEINYTNKGFVIPRKVLTANYLRTSTGQNITTAGDGGNLAATLPVHYVDALKNAMILPALGVNYLTGLTGQLPIVNGGLFSAAWASEGTAVDTAKAALTKKIMTAKRLTATGAFSKELLRQSSLDVENWVRMGLIEANAQALLSAAVNGSGQNGEPAGILNTLNIGDVAGGTSGAAPTWSHIVNLESKVANANADQGRLGYLTNSKVRGKLKQTLKSSGVSGYIWDQLGMNGYNCGVSNAVPSNLEKGSSGAVCSAIIFGNWADMMIGEWGGLDICVDPYTLKNQGDVEITVHTFADIAIARPESFAAMKDALTA